MNDGHNVAMFVAQFVNDAIWPNGQEQSNLCERIGHCRGASTRRVPSRVAYAGESFDTYSTIERRSSNAGSVQMALPIQPPSAQPPLGIRPDLRRLLPY